VIPDHRAVQVELVAVAILVDKDRLDLLDYQVLLVLMGPRVLQDRLGLVNKVSEDLQDLLEQLDSLVSQALLVSQGSLVLPVLLEILVIEELLDLLVDKAHQEHVAEMVRSAVYQFLPAYLHLCSCDAVCSQRLSNAHRRLLDVPRYQRLTLGRRAFSVAGLTVWNSLPDELRDETEDMFWKSLKTLFFGQY